MKYVVITGISSGIGYATARDLTQRGYHVFGSVRRAEDGERVKGELGANFTPLLFDVTDAQAVLRAAAGVAEHVGTEGLTALVNNAGIAVIGPLELLPLDAIRQQLEVNVVGQISVIQAFLPMLAAANSPGRIINIGSTSGRTAYPFIGAYAASKHALEAISDSLRRELMPVGVDVVLIEAGIIRTALLDKTALADTSLYNDTVYGAALTKARNQFVGNQGIPMERVTNCIRQAMESKRPRTRYVLVGNYLLGWLLPGYLPDRLVDFFVRKWLNMAKK